MTGDEALARMTERRAATVELIDSLTRLRNDVVAAAEYTNGDDEHDPEGATVAFERERLRAELDRLHRELADLDRATERLRQGSYTVCESCGGPIGAERLAARPAARTCISCAATR
ncbi:TraR/DksA family transcriptional regulator [Streptomyces sp. NPDC059740]|uniref:TraR/DksA family transcriptional regulator n=1 Tax=Streptomyces sp. NPDC059740 TaxID=3346926 RepID=UPI0036471534